MVVKNKRRAVVFPLTELLCPHSKLAVGYLEKKKTSDPFCLSKILMHSGRDLIPLCQMGPVKLEIFQPWE